MLYGVFAHPRIVRLTAFTGLLLAAGAARADVTYNWSTFTPGDVQSWSGATVWSASGGSANANNYPGGGAAVDDVAVIAPTGVLSTYTINFTGMNAPTLGSLSVTVPAGLTATDTLTLNVTSGTLATAGGVTFTSGSNTTGRATLNVAGTINVGGSMATNGGSTLHISNGGSLSVANTLSGANSGTTTLTIDNGANLSLGSLSYGTGNANWAITIGGTFSTGSLSTNTAVDAANITITSTASASLGDFTLSRSNSGSSIVASSAGLHIQGGTHTAGNFIIGANSSAASAAIAELSGGQLTVSGSTFAIGQSNISANTNRRSTIFLDGGTLIGTNSAGLVIGQSNTPNTGGTVSSGAFVATAGTATLEKITLGGALASNASSPGSNSGTLTIDGGNVYVGSGGIVGTTAAKVNGSSMASSYSINLGGNNGGVLGSKAAWSSSANMTLQGATAAQAITFRTADSDDNPFDITLSGTLSGALGGFNKSGGGTLNIQGINTYAGPTGINEGTLMLTGTLSGSGVTVAPGATLAGTGNINANVQLNGILSPGSGAGMIHVGSNLSFGSNSQLLFDLGSTASAGVDTDLVSFNTVGNNLSGANLATLALQGTIDYTKTYTIFDNTTSTDFTFANITGFDSTHYAAIFGGNGNNGYSLSFDLLPTPEPGALALLGLGAVALLLRRPRRS